MLNKILLLLVLAVVGASAAQPTGNIPIGRMPIATNLKTSAYIPIIQPYDGRTTNDNFRISSTNWMGFTTNSPVNNFYATNIYVTNLFVSNIVNGGELWMTNASGAYLPSIVTTPTIVVGQGAEAWWGPGPSDGFVSVHDASLGDSAFNSLAIAAIDTALQEDFSQFFVTTSSGAGAAASLQLRAATNYQNPSAPISQFNVLVQPSGGAAEIDLQNNGVHTFQVVDDITSVKAFQLVPFTNSVLALGFNSVNVASNSYVALAASDPDPNNTGIQLSTGLRDGMLLLLQNISGGNGFTLYNGSSLYDDPTYNVTLSGGNWATTNAGDGLLLLGGTHGWSEVGRFTQNTNTLTSDLWANNSGVYEPTTLQTSLLATNIGSMTQLTAFGGMAISPVQLSLVGPGDFAVDATSIGNLFVTSDQATPTDATLRLNSTPATGNMLFVVNVSAGTGFQMLNGDETWNNAAQHLYLRGGNWTAINPYDTILLVKNPAGWSEVARFAQNTNLVTESLWEMTNNVMRTVPIGPEKFEFRYGAVPQVTIGTNGGIAIGPNTPSLYGALGGGDTLISIRDVALGDANSQYLYTKVQNTTNGSEYSSFESGTAVGAGNGVYFQGNASDLNGDTKIFYFDSTTNAVRFWITDSGLGHGALTTLDPYVGGIQPAAYWFDTAVPVTGTNLFSVNNFGTNQFSVAPNSGYTGTGTNWFGDDGKFHSTMMNTNGGNLSGSLTAPFVPYATGTDTLADSPLYRVSATDMGLDGALLWGPGSTNALYRSGADLLYTNGAAARFSVVGAGGYKASLRSGSNVGQVLGEDSGGGDTGMEIGWITSSAANYVRFWSSLVHPMQLGTVLGGNVNTSPQTPFRDLNLDGTGYWYGYISGVSSNYSRASLQHRGTNSTILLSSQGSGIAGIARPFEINRNLGATLAVGDTAVVDMFTPSATNAISGTMTFTHATNGLDLVEFTHVRTFFNGSGSDQTVNLPSGWHKGTGGGSAFVVTNATMAKLYVTCMGPTGSAALQTNITVTVSYFP